MQIPQFARFLAILTALALAAAPLAARQDSQPEAAAPAAPASGQDASKEAAESLSPGLSAEGQSLVRESQSNGKSQLYISVITRHFPRRLTGSTGIKLAQDWARQTFEDMGLDARLEAWGEVPVGFDRGAFKGRMLAPDEVPLTFITPAWTPGTQGPLRGPAMLEPATREEALELGEELRGKWIVRNRKLRGRGRSALHDHYSEQGALGIVAAGTRDGRLVMSGNWDVDYDDLPTLVRPTLLYDQYIELVRALEEAQVDGSEVELEFDIAVEFLHGPITQFNVVADLHGSELSDEFVIVQGHIDAWDGAQGACDNGTGVATTLEAARLLASLGITPRRTLRFVLYSGEEQGLLGSRGFVSSHEDELERISIVLNHDNGTNFLRGLRPTEAMLPAFEEVFASILTLDPERLFEIRTSPGLGPGPSDHSPFITKGVPAFHWNQSSAGYRRLHHTQHDTLAEVDADDQRHSSLVIALAAWGFANLDESVDRTRMRLPEPRRMGVYLDQDDGRLVERVISGTLAESAGWQAGDLILAIDGVEVSNRREIVAELQLAGPRKEISLERAGERVETVLDYSDDPMEKERANRDRADEEQPEPEPEPKSVGG
ncbi:MAG: M20/M25/M40 family metallo-hydrolase [bacterium]|nr:M20/M25/M40 family metallo-hydrolase [Planctomycetota bacterium]HIL51587.1 M20/M25/M40 family metallo-hydrolase [Planctomycetota bacterium]